MPTTEIQVTAADNEIMLIACSATGSSELLHFKSGCNKPVDVTLHPGAMLSTGSYTLVMIGLNWGGSASFTVVVTTDGRAQTFHGGAASAAGSIWSQSIPMSVINGQ